MSADRDEVLRLLADLHKTIRLPTDQECAKLRAFAEAKPEQDAGAEGRGSRGHDAEPFYEQDKPRPAVTVEEIRDKLYAAMPQSCRLQCTGEEVALRLARVAFEMMGGAGNELPPQIH